MAALVPFGFAYVDETQNVFDASTMFTMDEHIFEFDLICEENNIPILELTIQNPRVGLLSHGRMVWAWFSFQPEEGHIVPLFFGVLEAIPSDLALELIKVRFQSRSPNFISLKQAAAEALKVRPYYDPVFIDVAHRDDPDSVLEGYSAQWDVSPTTLAITASDYLVGEDGLAVFTGDDAFYEDFHQTIGEAPLTNVSVQMRVHWTQRCFGYVDMPATSIASYTGDTVYSGWLKNGETLGGGWKVERGYVFDTYKVNLSPTYSISNNSTNLSLAKNNCDTDTTNYSHSVPCLLTPATLSGATSVQGQGTECDPFGDPPIIVGGWAKISGVVVPCWFLTCTATLRYDALRDFNEIAVLDITADTQNVFTSPTFEQTSKLLTLEGADVGQPLIEYLAYTDFAGGAAVALGDTIFPNDPTTSGGLAYQVCTQAGNTNSGGIEPEFSDVPGTTVVDGTVHWTSAGTTPSQTIPRMTFATSYNPGAILAYFTQTFDPNVGELVDTGAVTYYILPNGGSTTSTYTEMTYVPPITESDEPTPVPVTIFLEAFDPPAGAVGLNSPWLGIPIGGTETNVTARNYFASDRGNWSLDYGVARARAILRKRARMFDYSFACPIVLALGITTRMSVALEDPRLPGGVAEGKVKKIRLHGADGIFYGTFDVGCSVGLAGSVHPDSGTPSYAAEGSYAFAGHSYQFYVGAINPIAGSDIGISYPPFAPYDDGINFPLTSFPGTVTISGTAAAQVAPIEAAIAETKTINTLSLLYQNMPGYGGNISPSSVAWIIEDLNFFNYSKLLPYAMEANAVSIDILIPPVVNGPFSGAVAPVTTPLLLPKGVDLSAGSSP